MNRKFFLIIATLLLLSGLMLYILNQNKISVSRTERIDNRTESREKIVSKADYVFETVRGKKIEIDVADRQFIIKGMENKIVFLKVFGWDCKFCKKEIPELIRLKKELGDSFEVIAIEAQQHTKSQSLEKIKALGVNYHIVSGSNEKDFYRYLQEKYGWTGIIPLTIVLSKGGDVLAFELGAKSYSLSELMKASLLRD